MRSFSKLSIILAITLLIDSCIINHEDHKRSNLETIFTQPPDNSKPWVYWYWMRANATKEGITRDLEAMAEAGIGGAYLMTIGNSEQQANDKPLTLVDPPADPLTEYWWNLIVFATKEAERLGLHLAMNACDGWALAGGPWIIPEMSMQEIVTSKRDIEGGKAFVGKLDQPTTRQDYYRDIAILAYPSVEGTNITSTMLKPEATTNIPGFDPQKMIDGTDKAIVLSQEGWIQYEFEKPFTCRSIKILPDQRSAYQLHRVQLLVSNDGKTFHSLGRLKPTEYQGWQDGGIGCTHSIEEVSARYFRFVIDTCGTPAISENREGTKIPNRKRLAAQQIELSSQPKIDQWEGKAGYRWRRSEWTTKEQCPTDLCVPLKGIINITEKMDPDGILTWTPPPGKWTIQRIGYTTTGETNNPAGTGVGLECDKFNPDAAKLQFDGWFGEALKRVGPERAGKILNRNHTDSWEAHSQNWSPRFRDEFVKRRGYDPVPWLPAMSGVPIESAELSERFLYDIRRTIADLVCDNFYDPLVRAGRDHGTTFSAECIAPTMMSDGLQHFKYADLPMGEFWLNSKNQDKPNDIRDAISGGHIYGKKVIGAEAFTENPLSWKVDPFYLKPLGDYNFAKGINQFVLHVWAHQAFNKKPGVTLNRVGSFFSGTQTWYKPGKAWFEYLHRCSEMLRQGLPVIDVCYFIGEEEPARSFLRKDLPIPLPEGYSYDCINRDALLTRAKAVNGRLVLPDGMSYRLLVLAPASRMTPEVAQKIGELASAEVPVIGSSPTSSISLTNYPASDQNLRNIVKDQWSSVRHDSTLQTTFEEIGISPDIQFIGVDMKPLYHEKMEYTSPPLVWNHRRTKDADIYFISNQERKSRKVEVAFRIKGLVPELWDASTDKICDAAVWHQENNRTFISLNFSPSGSVFVVFRRKTNYDPVASMIPTSSGNDINLPVLYLQDDSAWAYEAGTWELIRQSGKKEHITLGNIPEPKVLKNDWMVSFEPGLGVTDPVKFSKLESLDRNENDSIKYFSGTATYRCSFELAVLKKEDKLFLDLGKVANLADVNLNGHNLGILWKPPFIVEITPFAKQGKNDLQIAVTNTWYNRLVGDAGLTEDKRVSWLLFKEAGPDAGDETEESGLIGPVRLITGVKLPTEWYLNN